jgi:hypothetical protein
LNEELFGAFVASIIFVPVQDAKKSGPAGNGGTAAV